MAENEDVLKNLESTVIKDFGVCPLSDATPDIKILDKY